MDNEEEKGLIAQIKKAIALSRGYADHFCWPLDRNLEEYGIAKIFSESLEDKGQLFFDRNSLRERGRGNDPPDCEATDLLGKHIGIEVTELVDPVAIQRLKISGLYEWAEWDRPKIIRAIDERLKAKDIPAKIKGGPYANYIIIIHTDEPYLNETYVNSLLRNINFEKRKLINRAFLLLSYDPKVKKYPYVELTFST
ncbi:MAG: hypothetical protein NTW65_01300 [Deltaproteobacteria bacterium]|nr:hypothetical protein [Deltaproteobacteria bacterium]